MSIGTLRVAWVPLTDAAPVIIAREMGFAAAEGIALELVQARSWALLRDFLADARRHGVGCVRIVHGKGLGSPGKSPVLKGRVHSWLVQKNEVIAFCAAGRADGGAIAARVKARLAG